ncbi:hypothetical protein LAZ67_3001594 [Cordylochernes scorpioides]|uniref:Defective in cullin neddylation protein n=1 Tax=Cordylochernes scorpioides TaxID=51811 RepID=A0ABY6K718_9ARAC|nr:hypothetical protein LAZ67_3001594 [Cordylochernes scorpioides]
MEWKGKDEPRTKKSRLCKSKNKVLLVTFFDIRDIEENLRNSDISNFEDEVWKGFLVLWAFSRKQIGFSMRPEEVWQELCHNYLDKARHIQDAASFPSLIRPDALVERKKKPLNTF